MFTQLKPEIQMSLNFVSTTVLSSTDGVSHNTETRVEGSGATSVSRPDNYKPLYQQLRNNAQDEQEKYDEITKAMRGTRALDDEDVAHLQGIEDERAKRLRLQKLKEKEELENYRLAKLDHQDANASKKEKEMDRNISGETEKRKNVDVERIHGNEDAKNSSTLMQLQSKIVVTRKRRRKIPAATLPASEKSTAKIGKIETKSNKEKDISLNSTEKDKKNEGGLGGLLCGYGSDSDSD